MNILSFDIEEWYLEKKLHGGREFRYQQFDDAFVKLMDKLDVLGIKATFFCVGRLALDFPQTVKTIAERGHEVGCHSNEHIWLTEMNETMLRQDTMDAIKALEDVSGQKVVSYRAPAFSVTEKNKWALNVLAECGIENDSSIFPDVHDCGGYPTFKANSPCILSHNNISIKEYPISLASFCGKRIAYSGGGYFRLLPYSFIKRTIAKHDYNICYFHLNDLINQKINLKSKKEYEEYFKEPGTLKNRLMRYLKSNIGTGDAYGKFSKLLSDYSFSSIRDCNIDWSKAEIRTL
jgi:polysaccharide deacetylase family protein (PEP-CTERM system associated)